MTLSVSSQYPFTQLPLFLIISIGTSHLACKWSQLLREGCGLLLLQGKSLILSSVLRARILAHTLSNTSQLSFGTECSVNGGSGPRCAPVFLLDMGSCTPQTTARIFRAPHILSGVIPKVNLHPIAKTGRRRRGPLFLDMFSWNFALTIDSLGQDDICWFYPRIALWEFRGKGSHVFFILYPIWNKISVSLLSHCSLNEEDMILHSNPINSWIFLLSFRKFSWVSISSLLYALQTISRVLVFFLIIIFYQFYWGMGLWSFLHCHARSGILYINSFILSLPFTQFYWVYLIICLLLW